MKATVRSVKGSPRARASAYWNASVMQANRGDIKAAVPLAERALALLLEAGTPCELEQLHAHLWEFSA